MFRDRINAEKKKLNISAHTMSLRSKLKIPEETIQRVLSGKTTDPYVSTVLDIADTVGLEPCEIFMDEETSEQFKRFQALKNEVTINNNERDLLSIENARLREDVAALTVELERLKVMLAHKEELLSVHAFYNRMMAEQR